MGITMPFWLGDWKTEKNYIIWHKNIRVNKFYSFSLLHRKLTQLQTGNFRGFVLFTCERRWGPRRVVGREQNITNTYSSWLTVSAQPGREGNCKSGPDELQALRLYKYTRQL